MLTSILTIDPGTRFWGVSVFHGRNFNISFIKKLSTKASPGTRLHKARKLLLSLFKKYAPEVLVIEKPYEFWEEQSEYLGRIIGGIKGVARQKKIKVIEFSPKTARILTCQDERATKEQMAQAISQSYPELKDYLAHSQKYNNEYWARMIGSIVLGICYLKHRKKY